MWNTNSQSYEAEQIQAMAVVHNFPSTSWLEATDGTSNSSFSQSPALAPSALASTWHHNEKDRLGKKRLLVVLDKCNSLSKAQHARRNTRWNITHKHTLWLRTHSQTPVLFPATLGDHQEGTVEENNERCLNYLESGFGSSRDTSSVPSFFLTNLNKF